MFFGFGHCCGREGCARWESTREPRAMPRHKVPAPQANGVAARLRPPPEAGGGREVFGRGWGLIFQNVKSDISGIFRGLVGKRWKMGALGITPPSSLVLLPIEGRRSPWRRLRNADMVSGVRGCFMVIKVILRGVLMFFWFGHWLWSRGLREVGKHARAPGDAMPQSACSAGRRSRSATSSTTGGMREPRAMPCHKVPAPQADGVAARLRPPLGPARTLI